MGEIRWVDPVWVFFRGWRRRWKCPPRAWGKPEQTHSVTSIHWIKWAMSLTMCQTQKIKSNLEEVPLPRSWGSKHVHSDM